MGGRQVKTVTQMLDDFERTRSWVVFALEIETRDAEWRALLEQAEKAANEAFDRLAVQSARLVSEARREGEIEALKLVLVLFDAHGLVDYRESVLRGCKGTRRHVEELITKLEAGT